MNRIAEGPAVRETEVKARVLAILHEPRFADLAPAEVYATLLDEGAPCGMQIGSSAHEYSRQAEFRCGERSLTTRLISVLLSPCHHREAPRAWCA